MQGVRALLTLVLIALLSKTAHSATHLLVETQQPVSSYSLEEGPQCTYRLTLNLASPLPGPVRLLRNGITNVTGLALIETRNRTVIIDTLDIPPLKMKPGDYYAVTAGDQVLAQIYCPLPAQENTSQHPTGSPLTPTRNPGAPGAERHLTPPPPRLEGEHHGPGYKGYIHLLVSAAAGTATAIAAVKEHGGNRKGSRSA